MPVNHWAADWHTCRYSRVEPLRCRYSGGEPPSAGGKSRKGVKAERKGDGGGGEGRRRRRGGQTETALR